MSEGKFADKALAGLIVLFLLVGLATFQDYGASYDEPGLYNYARETWKAYLDVFEGVYEQNYTDPIQKHYGPFLFLLFGLWARGFAFSGLLEVDLWHLAYFFLFVSSLPFLYQLVRRWISPVASLGVVALFTSQPLIWGHIFMNPKDTPFIAMSIFTLFSGLKMIDFFVGQSKPVLIQWRDFQHDWRFLRDDIRKRILKNVQVLFILILFLLASYPILRWLLDVSFVFLFEGPARNWISSFFGLNAATPANQYVHKASIWLGWLEIFFFLLLVFYVIVDTIRRLSGIKEKLSDLLRWITTLFINRYILIAAFLLGVTVSLRLTATLLAVLMLVFLFWRLKTHAMFVAWVYGILSLGFMYFVWPFLWVNPIKNLIRSTQAMSDFSVTGSNWYDYPVLLVKQFTEPAILLVIVGIILFLFRIPNSRKKIEFGLFFCIFGMLPLFAIILGKSFLYDNFRQVLFLWLPFFVLTGVSLEWLFGFFQHRFAQLGLLVVFCSVGWFASFQLHPYQYVYYNNISGGLVTADSQKQLTDYWGISFKEAAYFLNQHALRDARVIVCGPPEGLQAYLRSDISVSHNCQQSLETAYDYAVLNSRGQSHVKLYPAHPVIYTTGHEQVVFTVIKDLRKK
jgi:hypothetical protein